MIYFGWVSSAPTEEDIEVKVDLFIKGRFNAADGKKGGKPAGKAKSAKRKA
jgi:hypothetical protein